MGEVRGKAAACARQTSSERGQSPLDQAMGMSDTFGGSALDTIESSDIGPGSGRHHNEHHVRLLAEARCTKSRQ